MLSVEQARVLLIQKKLNCKVNGSWDKPLVPGFQQWLWEAGKISVEVQVICMSDVFDREDELVYTQSKATGGSLCANAGTGTGLL